jgi:hypothetical protein
MLLGLCAHGQQGMTVATGHLPRLKAHRSQHLRKVEDTAGLADALDIAFFGCRMCKEFFIFSFSNDQRSPSFHLVFHFH